MNTPHQGGSWPVSYHRLIRTAFYAGLFAFVAMSSVLPARAVDVLTDMNDNNRTGRNPNETILNTSNVNQSTFGKVWAYSVSGSTYAQPLYVSGVSIAGGTHNVVYIETMNDQVYAFDADSNTQLWHVSFTGGTITPVPITDITGNNGLNIVGNVGIESTPVIDKSTGTIYMLARTKDTSTTTYFQTLHALDLSTGAEKFGGPKVVTASGFDPKRENQRMGLAMANGNIIITWTSHEDLPPYHGWMMAYSASTLAQVGVFNDTATGTEGGIWQQGRAPAVDASGNVYVITGNGTWDGSSNFGESFLKLSPTLTVLDWFTPDNYSSLNSGDEDLGASGAMLIPGTSIVMGGGKQGTVYLCNTNGMGHEQTGNGQIIQHFTFGSGQLRGGPVYYVSPVRGPVVYDMASGDHLKEYTFNGSTFATTPVAQSTVTSPGLPGGFVSISDNNGAAGSGIVWATIETANNDHGNVSGIIRAWNADNIGGTELWDSNQNATRDALGTFVKDAHPTIANGRVYVGSYSNRVDVYGLLSARVATPSFSPAAGTYSSAQNVTISTTTSGATIRYTTDGSTPSETAGTIYSGPVNISATTTLKAIAYESGFTDSAVNTGTYTISTGTGGSVSFEAENLSYTPSGATASLQTDANSSNGHWVVLSATGPGQYIDYAIPSLAAGTYQLQMEWKGLGSRGILQLSVDGTNLGPTLDQYSATAIYPTTTFGTVTFASSGTHTIRLTVTGKNSASSGYLLSADRFIFTAQSGGGSVATPSFSPAAGTYSSAQNVTISTTTSGATIRYTTDGSTPSETAGTIYSGPVNISATTTLKAIAYESGFTDSAVTSATYTIGSGTGGTTVSFEAENLSYTPSGATASVQTDANSSNGHWVLLSGNSVGDNITFAIPTVQAGTYQLQMEWKGLGSRGILQLSVDGTNLGPTLDQYATAQTYPTTTFGTITFGTTGTHTVRLTVTSKNSASSGYGLSADKFTFTAQ